MKAVKKAEILTVMDSLQKDAQYTRYSDSQVQALILRWK